MHHPHKTNARKEETVKGSHLREEIFQFICSQQPGFTANDTLSLEDLNSYRRKYLASLIAREKGEIEQIDRDVLDAIRNNSILSENMEAVADDSLTFGQRIADKIASFGGSWMFIISFFSFILLWICTNLFFLYAKPFDPYPFILLNLLLSCLASIQAPIIMMSQNRQEDKDRKRSEHDYKVNLKAELEIRLLNEKMDHLIIDQSKKLLEIQQLQTDYLEDLVRKLKKE